MTKRRLLRWSLIFVALAAFAVWLEPTRVVWGWLRGEAFYQGRPTSWWAEELDYWQVGYLWNHGDNIPVYWRTNSAFEDFTKQLLRDNSKRPVPAALTGDPAAEGILTELLNHPTKHVREMARHGLDQAGGVAPAKNETTEQGHPQP